MRALDGWIEVWEVVRTHRVRSLLTMGGVFWGMLMLLLMAGFGRGLEQSVSSSLGGRGTNAVFMWGRHTSLPYKGNKPGRPVDFNNSDVQALQTQLGALEYMAPRNQLGGWRSRNEVVGNSNSGSFQVMGDVPEFSRIQPMRMRQGRFLNPLDMEQERKVAVIGAQVAAELWGRRDPTGEPLRINGVWFVVVGVLESRLSGDQSERAESTIHIPFTTFQRTFNVGDEVGWLTFTAAADASALELEQQARAILAARHGIHPDDEPALGSHNSEAEWRQLQATFKGIRAFVVVVGAFTLLSGVIGVSNILLVTVRERTAEIGLRRALGATAREVVGMILREAMVMVGVAGYAGLVVGVGLLELLRRLLADSESFGDPQVGLPLVASAGLSLLFAGAIAAFLPARRAAAISPVEALRSE
ncbi:MAG: ABC transporter permease [Myxococcota bacterium]|nr:ABC transporter permease [Myxococcota bacterium]